MGMFNKDKEYGTIVTNLFGLGEPFILWGARIKREDFPSTLGPATQSELTVSKLADPTEKFECTTLAGAIASKVREAEPTDFPAVVALTKVATKYGQDALVLQYLKPYQESNTATEEAPF